MDKNDDVQKEREKTVDWTGGIGKGFTTEQPNRTFF